MGKLLFTALLVIFNCILVLSLKPKIECGYKQCPQTRDGALNVHLIPHTHMDAGWVKTFDEYYYGTRTYISSANVQLIFHSVLSELLHDKRRKFTLSETAYFWRWWKEQRPTTRATFRSLVQEGRIEFAGGGWVQNDEATADYLHIIDQYTWGLRKLNDTLGPCGKPKAAWQIDTYGHTREQASLLAQMGFDGLFIGRVDHKEREALIEEDRMEFMWRGSDTLGKMSDIMTHTLFNLYNAPEGFCFDFLCNDEPIVDDPDSSAYNADKRVNDFVAQIERQAKYYDHDNIMVTMGGDFTYQSAANWFMNMDKLINHVNTHPANMSDLNIFYSTPSCYLKAIYLYGRRDKAVYTERGDHLPYGSDKSTYWTGYYTSRAAFKYFAKKAHTFLQVVKQLTVIARSGDSYELHLLRHAVSLILHHDAISGTSLQNVISDFTRMVSEAIEACTKKVSNLLSYLTPTWGGSRRSKNTPQFVICHQLNMSQCRFTETAESLLLLVYNPLSVKTYHYIRLPAIFLHYSIRDFNDDEVEYQLVPLPAAVINLPGRSSSAIQELCFEAENIPPLGFSSYYIAPVRDQLEENNFAKKASQKTTEADHELVPFIANEYLKVTVDKTTGFLQSIQHMDGVKINVSQNFYFYLQTKKDQQSGAYSFRPDNDRPIPVTNRVTYSTVRGSLTKEIRQRFSDWITQIIRLYRGEEFVELEWIIGPVPIGMDLGKEVVTLFTTNITNAGEFFTDSNSRQMMKRTCWNDSASQPQKKPIAACYYPVSSRICIRSPNSSAEMCVLTDRAQGGTSYNDGEIELMVQRRLLTDDGFGLEGLLNEIEFGVGMVVKGKHRIVFGNFRVELDDLSFSERSAAVARRWQMEPWLFFTSGEKVNRRKWQNVRNKRYSALRIHGLPRHIHILTLEPWKAGSVLLRLENTLEWSNPNRGNSKTDRSEATEDIKSHITVDLRKIFLHHQIKTVRETTLAANQWLDDARQMDWSTRYVYNGADDEIMPEDNIEDDDNSGKPIDTKDSAHYSDEEQEYSRKKLIQPHHKYSGKGRAKIKAQTNYDVYDRRKRSLNTTDSIIENIIIINETKNHETTTQPKTTSCFTLTTKMAAFKRENNTTRDTETIRPITKRTPKLSFLSKTKPTKLFVDWETGAEETFSAEDFSSNLKKRSSRRKSMTRLPKRTQPEIILDDIDEGVTKSIYDMYYRVKTKPSFKPSIRNSEGIKNRRKKNRRCKKTYDYDNLEQTTVNNRKKYKNRRRSKGKRYTADMPFFITDNARRYRENEKEQLNRRTSDNLENTSDESQEKEKVVKSRAVMSSVNRRNEPVHDTTDYEEEEVENDRDSSETTENNRKKRTLPKDDDQTQPDLTYPDSEQNVRDYVITLRPTQIRTFVIWFESNKKTYVI